MVPKDSKCDISLKEETVMSWKKMGIGTKLSVGFGVVLLLLVLISGYSYLRLRGINHAGKEAVELGEANEFLLEKEIDHLKWMTKLSDLFLKEDVKTVQVQTDDHKCGFGKWLYGQEAKHMAAKDSEMAALMASIKEPHRKLHDSATKIEKTHIDFDTKLGGLLAERWIDHLTWIKNLSNALLTHGEFKGGVDPHKCAFGKWFYSYKATDPRFAEILSEWEKPHARLHDSAAKIVKSMAQGNADEARKLYQEETLLALNELTACYGKTTGWVHEATAKQEAARKIFDTDTVAAVAATQQILGKMREHLAKQSKEASQQMEGAISSTTVLVSIASIVAIILGILGAVVITLGITKPVRRIIDGLNSGAEQVASASSQVSSASQSLAEGGAEQAASIEETSSSLEEMSSMTKQNANNANQANNLMKEANQVVTTANDSMGELTTSMGEISKASEETSKIIKTIDEIAFQTNLLALNAAVEAARAGEAGAGFAVVADEVRNLAMRAAAAAKNTADLIEGTVKKVKDGEELVKRTNEAFSHVAESAYKVGELVAEIAAASNEQAQGIEQVNTAVVEMDKVVQQNAANAEESASASEEMNAQAEEMKHMVNELVALVEGAAKAVKDRNEVVARPERMKAQRVLSAPGSRAKSRRASTEKAGSVRAEQIIPLDDDSFSDF